MSTSPRKRAFHALQEQRQRWAAARFAMLATILLLSIGVLMLAAQLVSIEHRLILRLILQLVMYAPLVVGVYVVSGNTRFVVVWGAGLVIAVALGLLADIHGEHDLLLIDLGIRCVLMGALMFWVAREMLRDVRVSLDTILGGICLYILIGYLYAMLYLMLILGDPTSILVGGQPLDVALSSSQLLQTVSSIFYFSFTAFTTMGFGDITSVSPLARYVTITEGMLGQLYPAIFIARLVSLNLIHAASPPGDD